jgi:uncharacterized protein (TIGR02246 family)
MEVTVKSLLLFACIALLGASCQSSSAALSEADRTAIADSARQLARDFIAADHSKDPDRVVAFFSDSADVAIASNGALRPSRQAFREALVQLYGSTRSLDIQPDTTKVTVLGRDAAAVTQSYHYSRVASDGRRSGGIAVITYVCQRQGGRWKITHYHFSQRPDPV